MAQVWADVGWARGLMMRGMVRVAVVLVLVSCLAGVASAAWALEENFPFEILGVSLGEEPSTVVVSVRYSCGPLDFGDGGADAVVKLSLRQQTANGWVTGVGYVYPTLCNGSPQTEEATVSSVDGRAFVPGRTVTVVASGTVKGLEGQQTTTARADLPLLAIPPSFSFSVDADAEVLPRGGVVVLTGTYTCGPMELAEGDPGRVDLTVRQDDRGDVAWGSVAVPITVCDGTPQTWSATVTTDDERFRRGSASVVGSGFVCGQPYGVLACQTVEDVQQNITLSR